MRPVGPAPIVYLGPSLPPATAAAVLAADYRPPIKRGDLPVGYDGTIIIIDGEFQQSLSVSPKEILHLLDKGTRVIGAASMGALRAVELARYGMKGFGWVFEAYRSGRLEADDEVAVSYSPEDMRCLTVPLVNVRRWLDELSAGGDIDEWTAAWLLERARRLFYADRTPERLWATWSQVITKSELERVLAVTGGQITDVKAADALMALNTLVRESLQTNSQEHDHGRPSTTEREDLQGTGARACRQQASQKAS